MCGDRGQPPPFHGLSPHEFLKDFVHYYKVINDDHRALDPKLRELKKLIVASGTIVHDTLHTAII